MQIEIQFLRLEAFTGQLNSFIQKIAEINF